MRVVTVHGLDAGDGRAAADIANAVGRLGVREPVLLDADFAVSQGLGARSYPTFVLVDRAGRVRYRHPGGFGWRGERGFVTEIEVLLAEK